MPTEMQELSETVASWLLYKSFTGLRNVLSEASLAVPIGEFLASKHGREVIAEENHPVFRNGGRGRPWQLDFVRMRRGDRNWHSAYETKFSNLSFASIVRDIARLLCLSQADGIGNPDRFLIIADSFSETIPFLSLNINNPGGPRINAFEGILSVNNNVGEQVKIFDLRNLSEGQKAPFMEFVNNSGVRLPSTIRTELVGLSDSNKRFVCGIWRISARQGHGLLDASGIRNGD